jgi:hypothetical protein
MVIYHVTIDNTGRQIDRFHENFQGVRAVGLDTGQQYQVHGVTNYQNFYVTQGSIFTYTSQLHVLGQGAGNDLAVYYTIHYSVNSNGEYTAMVDSVRTECR